MKIQMEKHLGGAKIEIDTDFIWNLKTTKTFDEVLIEIIVAHKNLGYRVSTNLSNFDSWDYIYSNLDNGAKLVDMVI